MLLPKAVRSWLTHCEWDMDFEAIWQLLHPSYWLLPLYCWFKLLENDPDAQQELMDVTASAYQNTPNDIHLELQKFFHKIFGIERRNRKGRFRWYIGGNESKRRLVFRWVKTRRVSLFWYNEYSLMFKWIFDCMETNINTRRETFIPCIVANWGLFAINYCFDLLARWQTPYFLFIVPRESVGDDWYYWLKIFIDENGNIKSEKLSKNSDLKTWTHVIIDDTIFTGKRAFWTEKILKEHLKIEGDVYFDCAQFINKEWAVVFMERVFREHFPTNA